MPWSGRRTPESAPSSEALPPRRAARAGREAVGPWRRLHGVLHPRRRGTSRAPNRRRQRVGMGQKAPLRGPGVLSAFVVKPRVVHAQSRRREPDAGEAAYFWDMLDTAKTVRRSHERGEGARVLGRQAAAIAPAPGRSIRFSAQRKRRRGIRSLCRLSKTAPPMVSMTPCVAIHCRERLASVMLAASAVCSVKRRLISDACMVN